MVDVPHVVGELLTPCECVAAVALRPARYTGAHFVTAGLFGRIKRQIAHEQRAGADETHVALEHVDEL